MLSAAVLFASLIGYLVPFSGCFMFLLLEIYVCMYSSGFLAAGNEIYKRKISLRVVDHLKSTLTGCFLHIWVSIVCGTYSRYVLLASHFETRVRGLWSVVLTYLTKFVSYIVLLRCAKGMFLTLPTYPDILLI